MDDIFEELREQDDIEVIQEGDAEEATEVPVPGDGDGGESRRVVAVKKRTSRPRLKLDPTRLTGPRGIDAIEPAFKNIEFKGKGHELTDITNVLNRLQHWAHRLYPRMNFEDCIARIEELGNKKQVQRAVVALRLGMTENVVSQVEERENELEVEPESESIPQEDPFDRLLDSAPSQPQKVALTEEQRARMLRNRLIAEERRMAKLKEKERLQQQSNAEEENFRQQALDEKMQLESEISSGHLFDNAHQNITETDSPVVEISNFNKNKTSLNETAVETDQNQSTIKETEIDNATEMVVSNALHSPINQSPKENSNLEQRIPENDRETQISETNRKITINTSIELPAENSELKSSEHAEVNIRLSIDDSQNIEIENSVNHLANVETENNSKTINIESEPAGNEIKLNSFASPNEMTCSGSNVKENVSRSIPQQGQKVEIKNPEDQSTYLGTSEMELEENIPVQGSKVMESDTKTVNNEIKQTCTSALSIDDNLDLPDPENGGERTAENVQNVDSKNNEYLGANEMECEEVTRVQETGAHEKVCQVANNESNQRSDVKTNGEKSDKTIPEKELQEIYNSFLDDEMDVF